MFGGDAKNSAACEPIDPQLTNTSSRVWYYRPLYARRQQYECDNFRTYPEL